MQRIIRSGRSTRVSSLATFKTRQVYTFKQAWASAKVAALPLSPPGFLYVIYLLILIPPSIFGGWRPTNKAI